MRRRKRKIQTTEGPWGDQSERDRDFHLVFSAQIPHQQRTGVKSEQKDETQVSN